MRLLLTAVWLIACAVPAYAQSEAALKEFFEGKTVVVKMDMPATAEGVDVYPDSRQPVDFSRYAYRIKTAGTALKSGGSIIVTRIRVKDKLIEFQLGGGGFGTFGDDTSSSVYVPSVPKSNREKNLEREVKNEPDPARKRRLQSELDDLRADRAREDRRNDAVKAAAEEEKKQRIAQQRLQGGSRFNIRYQDRVPPGLGPDGVMRALEQYVEFPFAAAGDRPRPVAPGGPPGFVEMRRPTAAPGALHKGMTFAEVQESLGKPVKSSDRMEGTLKVTTAVFSRDDQQIQAEFVEGVLIKYSISSR
jgi:hypothetical protein